MRRTDLATGVMTGWSRALFQGSSLRLCVSVVRMDFSQ
jgi:hypothetical protein